MVSSAKEMLSRSFRVYGLHRRVGHKNLQRQELQRMTRLEFSSSSSSVNDATAEYLLPPPVKHASKFKGPIVNQLWDLRNEAKQKAAVSSRNRTIDMDRPRPPCESMTKISYEFEDDEFLMERYRNPFGHLRFGKVLEDLDALAGNIAYSHVQDPAVNIVTASVDRIRLSGSVDLKTNQHLTGKVTYVGTSSMEIRMQCKGDGEDDPWMEG
jgi:acyl-coenzyme A thioesterase 9